MDLKLPYLDGFVVLTEIRRLPSLRNLCVIVLSSSLLERDREQATKLGVKAYLVKPPTPEMIAWSCQRVLSECGGGS